eukprot:CAMPEP_0197717736 /NCGR_PEP_ID=MMETSP1434-20131217/2176_1 /TAXON_ID=265543 /ORGANISM="Minutocellus polymorphus, Strain CCMP3303" /LENGTH=218 /DNA_ID=CAMNT_0043302309 /DNA_START=230 /DNA_END=882 /DNA_ORIENTATION=+
MASSNQSCDNGPMVETGNISTGENKMHLPPLDLPYVSHIDDKQISPIPITDDVLCKDIESRFQDAQRRRGTLYDSLVIAGEGEPTLRLSTLLSVVKKPIRSACFGCAVPSTIRVVTNGLGDAVPENHGCAKQMKEAGVSGVSVALMTASSEQYDEWMHPCLPEEISTPALDVVCEFIRGAIKAGLSVEVTGVDREEVDKGTTEELARSLGVLEPVRWR